MKKYFLSLCFGLLGLISSVGNSNAQTSFPCDGTMYLSNGTKLYTYSAFGSQTELFDIGDVNALAFSLAGNLWAYKKDAPKSIVIIGSDGTIAPISISGLPLGGSIDYNVGAIDTNGYYYIYDGTNGARFYTIDTDPGRSTYGQLVDPTATSGVAPYSIDTRSPFGTPIAPNVPASNRRNFADWCINPVDGMMYAVTNSNSYRPFRLVKFDPITGNMSEVTDALTGGASPSGGFQSNAAFGAIFIDKIGNIWNFGNTRGYLYSIDTTNSSVTRLSTTSISSSNIDGANCVNSSSTLPIQLLSFNAIYKDNKVDLFWVTASEQIVYGFDVQRSTDAKNWTSLGFVSYKAENGNSRTELNYSLIDAHPVSGNNFYRLKQVDFDGVFTYSEVRTVKFDLTETIRIYPNPAQEELMIEGVTKGQVIVIYNALGQEVKRMTINQNGITKVNIANLADAHYQLVIIDGNKATQSFKFVKK